MLHRIYTFGYGNRVNYDQLCFYFKKHSISTLVDIRKSPKAWTRKWWKDKVSELCALNDVQYLSMPELGNTSGNAKWIPPDPEEAQKKLDFLLEIKTENVLLLCAELDYKRCHRTEVAELLHKLLEDSSVIHLL